MEALALLHNSLPFPFLRGSSRPGLSTIGLGSLVVEIPKSVSGTRFLEFVFPLYFSQVELLELPHEQPSYSLFFPIYAQGPETCRGTADILAYASERDADLGCLWWTVTYATTSVRHVILETCRQSEVAAKTYGSGKRENAEFVVRMEFIKLLGRSLVRLWQ